MTPETSSYLLLFRNTGSENYHGYSAEERAQIVQRWNAWFEGLLAAGKATEGQPLEPETRWVAGKMGARVVDGPYPETKEAIGGFVRLVGVSLEEATQIAQAHPGLEFGLEIEIRELTPHCHLGVTTRSAG